jgi:hypothetical protein
LSQDVDGRADLYSVGVIFYRLLTAALPFKADTPIALLQRQLSDTPIPPSANRDDLPSWCDTIVQRALAKAPADRFQTADEFRQTLAGAAGLVTTTDLAKAFVVAKRPDERLPRHVTAPTVVMPSSDAELAAAASSRAAVSGDWALRPSSVTEATQQVLAILRRNQRAAIVGATTVLVVAGLTLLVLITLRHPPASKPTFTAAPVAEVPSRVVFESKALVGIGRKQRERDARLVLADGTVTVIAADDRKLVHSVPYERVRSINYSHSRNPMWRSPVGPALVTHTNGGILRILHLDVARHWISLETNTSDRFVVLAVSETQVRTVLSALERRIGVTAQWIGKRTDEQD